MKSVAVSAAPVAENPPATESRRPLRLAYVATDYFDPTSVGAWSGLPYFIWHALEQQGIAITVIRLHDQDHSLLRWLRFGVSKLFARRRYLRDRDTALLRSYARQIQEKLEGQQFDFIFCPGTAPIAYLETKIPIAVWVDASFAGMIGFYQSFTHLAARSIAEGHQSEQAALGRVALAFYSSDWAADTARRAYGSDAAQWHVARFGANLSDVFDEAQILEIIRRREQQTCRLLLVGVDWERKGADVALAALEELEKLGVPAHLTVIGCRPPRWTHLPSNVTIVGYVSKSSEAGRKLIEQHFCDSHFFLMPSRAEAYGLVFCEANAYGLPCIATEVGGVPSIIENGVNGCLLPPDAPPSAYARRIAEIWQDRPLYETYARNCHRIYRERLNWEVSARKVVGLMHEHLAKNRDSHLTAWLPIR